MLSDGTINETVTAINNLLSHGSTILVYVESSFGYLSFHQESHNQDRIIWTFFSGFFDLKLDYFVLFMGTLKLKKSSRGLRLPGPPGWARSLALARSLAPARSFLGGFAAQTPRNLGGYAPQTHCILGGCVPQTTCILGGACSGGTRACSGGTRACSGGTSSIFH